MGLYDRDYTQEGYDSHYGGRPNVRMLMPQMTPVVKWLLIINVVVFILSQIAALGGLFYTWCSVWPEGLKWLQIWRLATYQFLHGDIWHIFFNMLWLYFMGPMLERFWGSRKFLVFYLICGAMGGVFYPILVGVGWLESGVLIGASGSVLGMLAAAAVLFPNMVVYVFGVIPVRMVVLALIITAISVLVLLAPQDYPNAGGEAAHLGGLAAGALYVVSENWRRRMKLKMSSGGWERQLAAKQRQQMEVDRILEKVHQHGIHSLTFKEKKILKQATRDQQNRH